MGAIALINFEKSSKATIGFDNDHLSNGALNNHVDKILLFPDHQSSSMDILMQ